MQRSSLAVFMLVALAAAALLAPARAQPDLSGVPEARPRALLRLGARVAAAEPPRGRRPRALGAAGAAAAARSAPPPLPANAPPRARSTSRCVPSTPARPQACVSDGANLQTACESEFGASDAYFAAQGVPTPGSGGNATAGGGNATAVAPVNITQARPRRRPRHRVRALARSGAPTRQGHPAVGAQPTRARSSVAGGGGTARAHPNPCGRKHTDALRHRSPPTTTRKPQAQIDAYIAQVGGYRSKDRPLDELIQAHGVAKAGNQASSSPSRFVNIACTQAPKPSPGCCKVAKDFNDAYCRWGPPSPTL
jgi:hypothetical protein